MFKTTTGYKPLVIASLGLVVTFTLGACSNEALVDSAYSDRAKFTYIDPYDPEFTYTYYCTLDGGQADAKRRSIEAHQYVAPLVEYQAERDAEALLNGDITMSQAMANIDAESEALVDKVEADYGCLVLPGEA